MMRKNWIDEFSPQNALEIERNISQYHRAKGSEGYSKAVEVIRKVIGDSKVLKYPAGKDYEGWKTPVGWNLKGGFLKVNGKYVVADLSLSPIAAIFMSGATNGIEKLPLVDVGTGENVEDYEEKEVSGKAVLASGDISRVYDLAVEKFGAKCVLSSFMRFQVESIGRTPELLPNSVNYTSFPAYANGKAFGFALNYGQYKWIKSLFKNGKVEIEASIDADRGNDMLEVIEARFGKSSSKKPLVMMAHLCHPRPGANDNASGSALLAELVRVLKKVGIDREVVALWVPEMYGTAAYLEDHNADFELGINLDMVGEDQAKTGSILQISSSPWSLPSFINDVVYANLQTHEFRMMTGKYSGGSDHFIFTDATIGVPTTSLTQFPDRFYHTSEDTPDKSSVKSFEWIGKGVLNSLFDLTYDFSKSTAVKAQANIAKEFVENYTNNEDSLTKKWIAYMAYKKMEDLSEYTNVEELKKILEPFIEDVKSMKRFPQHLRKIKGPIQDVWMNAEDREWFFKLTRRAPGFRDFRYELLNFMELGFSFDEAFELSKNEFEISQEIFEDAKYYVKRLSEEKII